MASYFPSRLIMEVMCITGASITILPESRQVHWDGKFSLDGEKLDGKHAYRKLQEHAFDDLVEEHLYCVV